MNGKSLNKIYEASGLTGVEFAKSLNIGRTKLYALFDAEEIPLDVIIKIKELYRNEQIEVVKESLNLNTPNAKEHSLVSNRKNLTMVPLKAFAGFTNGYEDKIFIESLERRYYPEIQGECFAFEVEGFSMYKSKVIDKQIYSVGYKPGSHVYTIPIESITYLNKNRNYVFQTVEGIILKRFIKIESDKCIVESLNEDYNPTPPIPLKEIKKIY